MGMGDSWLIAVGVAALALPTLVGEANGLPILRSDELVPPTKFDRVYELDVDAEEPSLIDGRGPTVVAEYDVEFSGSLHLWTSSELDLFARVENPLTGRILRENDDSGDDKNPYIQLTVQTGDLLAVLVAARDAGVAGVVKLHLAAAPESEVTRLASKAAEDGAVEARRLQQEGDLDAARALATELVNDVLAAVGARHSELVADVLSGLGTLTTELGALTASKTARSAARKHVERTRPEGHPDVLYARTILANTCWRLGDLEGARDLHAMTLAAHERIRPADHPDVLRSRVNLGATLYRMGDLSTARDLWEAALAGYERTLPEDHFDLLATRLNLAGAMAEAGDHSAARTIFESILSVHERTLPADHPELLKVRGNVALCMQWMGDLAGSRTLNESVLAGYERTLPEDHPELVGTRNNLASILNELGEHSLACSLFESVVSTFERTLAADHPHLTRARMNLGSVLRRMGELSRARTLLERVLEDLARTLPEEHTDFLLARMTLASVMSDMGDRAGARVLLETAVASCERIWAADHPDLLNARLNLANRMVEMDDLQGARALVPGQLSGMRARVMASLAFAPRQAREIVGAEATRFASALFLTRFADLELQRTVFELQETMRLVAGEAARVLGQARDPEIQVLMGQSRAVRASLGDLVSTSTEERDPEVLSIELTRLMQERDRLERQASRKLAERGVVTNSVEVCRLTEGLAADAALVGFRRIAIWHKDKATGDVMGGTEHLLAHVLENDGTLVRIDLGDAAELEELVASWRPALGVSSLRGISVRESYEASGPEAIGEELRVRLLDPILRQLGDETRRIHVCADDFLFLVPLDALPFEGGYVGDRWSIVNEVSYARLLAPVESSSGDPSLLALGGVAYDAGTAGTQRGDAHHRFLELPQTELEVRAIAKLFEERTGVDAVLLTGEGTTKAALTEHVTGKRFLHLATHGWFAADTIRSTQDGDRGDRERMLMGLQERVTGMVPMLLCGLALAGANQGRDSMGRMSGVLTAEEVCALDLSACDLAVLSACETNVGIRRAGQGIQSLQAALYAAGAKSSITSLWRVDDVATRRLMELFYRQLWEEKKPKAEALWEAKQALREAGAPTRDWAGWVLTGDPE